MKSLLLLFVAGCCLLNITIAQTKSAPKKRTSTTKKPVTNTIVKDAFSIDGTIINGPDSGTVNLLNSSTGQVEQTSNLVKGKFAFMGKMTEPDFKVLTFTFSQEYIMIFMGGGDKVFVKADASNLAKTVVVEGKGTVGGYADFKKQTKPFADVIDGRGIHSVATIDSAATLVKQYIQSNKNDFYTPIVTYYFYNLTNDGDALTALFNSLDDTVRNSKYGKLIQKQVDDLKNSGIGTPIADFSQADTSGNTFSLTNLKGKYVLIDFWASWCGPCRNENPNVVRAYNAYKDKNFTVLGVSLDKDKDKWLEAIKADGLEWTQLSDLKGWANTVAQQFGIQAIPQNILIDPAGKIIARNLRGAALEYKLYKLLN